MVETPEGVDLAAELAGLAPRALAYVIDFSIRLLIMLMLSILAVFFGEAWTGFLLLIMFLLEWFYPVFFECLYDGQTPGKKQLGIMVVNDDLTPIHFGTSLIRNLLRAVDFLPSLYVLGIVSMTLSKHFQRLGDVAAGTIVIYRLQVLPTRSLPNVPALSVPAALRLEDKLAIIQFTQSHHLLSQERQQELVDIVEPLFDAKQATVKNMQGIGLSLLG